MASLKIIKKPSDPSKYWKRKTDVEMTNQEAIEILRNPSKYWVEKGPMSISEALEKAIAALEQSNETETMYCPQVEYITPTVAKPDPCANCSNNPANGGSGICHCILGNPTIIC